MHPCGSAAVALLLRFLQIMQEGVAGAQAGWLMACKELFGRGKASDAMLLFLRGVQQQGYTGDAGLYAYAMQEMCKQGKLVRGPG